jgi:putative nucleotidyltransferase with HDIG domain
MERHGLAGHAIAVATLAAATSDALRLAPAEALRVQRAALLHDVGKLELPRSILDHPGPLGADGWTLVRAHPVAGARLVSEVPWLAGIAPLVRHHHEHWDGSGYPDGLAGTAIPIGARIIAACDAFCTMVQGRPYRRPITTPSALVEIRAAAGRQLDPVAVEALASVVLTAPSILP